MNRKQVQEFFRCLSKEYSLWKNERSQSSNAQFFDLSNNLNGTIFAYSGWGNTGKSRKFDEKDSKVISMLERSLDRPSVIVDMGTYDGSRLRRILDGLNKDASKNIIAIKGIDMNKDALAIAEQNFKGYNIPFHAHSERIEHINEDKFGKEKKINLYLENILFNIKDESTIPQFLSKKSRKDDVTIIEAHKRINNSLYPENIERFFLEYFTRSGIQDILGGRLSAIFSDDAKRVFIEDLPRVVRYNNSIYRFENAFIDDFGKKGIIEPAICIGVSRILRNSWNFMWELASCGFEAPYREDFQLIDDDVVLRLNHSHDSKFFKNLLGRNDPELNIYGGCRLDYLLRFEEYPKHYDTHPLIGRHTDQVEIVQGYYGR